MDDHTRLALSVTISLAVTLGPASTLLPRSGAHRKLVLDGGRRWLGGAARGRHGESRQSLADLESVGTVGCSADVVLGKVAAPGATVPPVLPQRSRRRHDDVGQVWEHGAHARRGRVRLEATCAARQETPPSVGVPLLGNGWPRTKPRGDVRELLLVRAVPTANDRGGRFTDDGPPPTRTNQVLLPRVGVLLVDGPREEGDSRRAY